MISYTLNNAGLFEVQPMVGSNMDEPNCWVKKFNLKKCKPTFGFIHMAYLTHPRVETTQHF